MFCRQCGREFKEGAKVCEGCGKSLPKQRHIPKQNMGWAMIVLGVILVGLGLCFALTALHDISLADVYGEWWLTLHGESPQELYGYGAAGIAGTILGVIVVILGLGR